MLESNLSVLYTALAETVALPEAKSLFASIAGDGYKHSAFLKDACEQLMKMKTKTRRGGNNKLDGLFDVTRTIYKDLITKEEAEQQLKPEELLAIAGKLFVLEKLLCGEYAVAQTLTLKFLGRETFAKRHASLDTFGSLFERLIDDSEQHQKILAKVESFVEGHALEETIFSVETDVLQVKQRPLKSRAALNISA